MGMSRGQNILSRLLDAEFLS